MGKYCHTWQAMAPFLSRLGYSVLICGADSWVDMASYTTDADDDNDCPLSVHFTGCAPSLAALLADISRSRLGERRLCEYVLYPRARTTTRAFGLLRCVHNTLDCASFVHFQPPPASPRLRPH